MSCNIDGGWTTKHDLQLQAICSNNNMVCCLHSISKNNTLIVATHSLIKPKTISKRLQATWSYRFSDSYFHLVAERGPSLKQENVESTVICILSMNIPQVTMLLLLKTARTIIYMMGLSWITSREWHHKYLYWRCLNIGWACFFCLLGTKN
jgi:hypothetical protein